MNYFLRIVLAYITVVILLQVISYLFNSNKSIVESLLTAVIPILAVIIVNYFYKKRTK
jgi:purine-cytosine permease-like protein